MTTVTLNQTAAIRRRRRPWLTPWQAWGLILIAPYILVFLFFVLYPIGYGFWIARNPQTYVHLFEDPIFARTLVNTIIFLIVGINLKMFVALLLSGLFYSDAALDPMAVGAFHSALGGARRSRPFCRCVSCSIRNGASSIRSSSGSPFEDGPNWLNDPAIALSMSILVHIWKSLPFWTLILIAARLAIPDDLYEAASVDGATSFQKFKFVTWPSMQTLYITCTILSMIWTLGDFNSVYLLTGGGPGDLTHVLATLGIRYLRLDQVDLSMAAIVVALPMVLPLVFFMMKRLSR